MTAPSAVGLMVPDFTLPATGGEFRLSAHAGKPLVIYFYPKDNTPGCTTEAGQFRDLHAEFAKLGCKIYGVSRDSLKSHEGFKAKLGLPFELISDADERACALFDVIKMKKLYGKEVRGIERSTFLIDTAGRLAREWRGVKVDNHAAEVLKAVAEL
ncbi:MAG: peroxiredoxin [Gammaproteobacteria bacterium]|nr:peroxiredoxin [Gammaproteobacteria bacterium]MBU1415510.1 peroxiredoxin [Gammaproteobacteria bacterium]